MRADRPRPRPDGRARIVLPRLHHGGGAHHRRGTGGEDGEEGRARLLQEERDAIERANLYREAGADVIFFEAPQSREEIVRVAREVKAPLLANMVQGGRTPGLKVTELDELGFKIVIFPGVCMRAAVPAIETALEQLKQSGTDWPKDGPVMGPMDIFRKVGFDWWHEVEERFA